jgi:N-acetylmuramoyl-L-alanine amidase
MLSALVILSAVAPQPAPAQAARVVKITVPNAAIRSGPSEEHDRVTVLPEGLKLPVVAREGDWYRVALGDTLQAYVSASVVELLPEGAAPSQARLADVSTGGFDRGTRVTIALSAPVPFRVIQRLRPAALIVELFNCRLAQYGIRQREGDQTVLAIEQVQLGTNTAQLTFHLPQRQQTGYQAYYRPGESALLLDIRRAYAPGELQGKLIGVDPGHGGHDTGARGRAGLKEKDANLEIALRLKQLLEAAGASVCMTRETDVALSHPGDVLSVQLDARRTLTRRAGVDLFVSVHNNDIGDGGPPAQVSGTETYYWTPMSILPARCVQRALCSSLRTNYRFTSWRPFYVLRDTDCPRILVECGYVSHPQEEARIKTPEFRARAAEGVFAGLQEFFREAMVGDGLEAMEFTPSVGGAAPPG